MNRWLLGTGFVVVVGLLTSLLVLSLSLATRGISVQLAEPIQISGPLTIGGNITVQDPIVVTMDAMEIRVPQPVAVELPGDALDVRATLGGAPCPHCGEGTLLPVRWNLLTGEITWRCTACGQP
ncbi:MAG: hypothetical protein Kow0097_10730 [Candidatus Bipolaricaulota bacterium]|nr:hypothetical protein [Candidatus Bipolaricaulota bacterium]